MNSTLMAATTAAFFCLSTFAPGTAAPVASAASKQPDPKAVGNQNAAPTTQPTDRFLTPRMMDRKRPMNPVCDHGFKPGAPSNCHY